MMARLHVVRLAAPACPTHHVPLEGGPVLYRCPATGHNVYAADIDFEFVAAPAVHSPLVIAAFVYALTASWMTLVFSVVS